MKKNALLLVAFSCFVSLTFAQTARVNFSVGIPKTSITIIDPLVNFDPAKPSTKLQPDAAGQCFYTAQVSKPRYVVAYLSTPDTSFFISPFLTPGDDLLFKLSSANKKIVFEASGKGSTNNQPDAFVFTEMNLSRFRGDTLPNRLWQAIKRQEVRNPVLLRQYIKKYRPSAAWVQNASLNNQYFALKMYYDFYHRSLFRNTQHTKASRL